MADNNILISYADESFLKNSKNILSENGYAPILAISGSEVIDIIKKFKVQLALIGIFFGDYTIFNIMQEIKELEPPPIIAIGGYFNAHLRERCIAAGVIDCAIAPSDNEKLLALVRSGLARAR